MQEATEDVLKKIETLEKLHNEKIEILPKTNREKDTLRQLFGYIESEPIFTIKDAVNKLDLSFNTVNTNIIKLMDKNIVKKYVDIKRNKVFIYEELMNVINNL